MEEGQGAGDGVGMVEEEEGRAALAILRVLLPIINTIRMVTISTTT